MELRAQRVLVVDDDGNVRHYVVDLLLKSGFDVMAARDGATARAAIDDARPTGGFDVILLDQQLPDCDGLGLLREMRRNGVETPVVIATAYPEFDYAREAGALGACANYQKPLFGRALLSAVRGAILRVPDSADAVELNSRLPGGGVLAAAVAAITRRDPRVPVPASLLQSLARAAATPDLGIAELVGVCGCLKVLVDASVREGSRQAAVERAILVSGRSTARDEFVVEVVTVIEAAGTNWARLTTRSVARTLHISESALSRRLNRDLLISLVALRRIVVVRGGLVQLGAGREHIAQIAYSLGFQSASHFVYAVRRVLGVSPTEFCRLLDLQLPPAA